MNEKIMSNCREMQLYSNKISQLAFETNRMLEEMKPKKPRKPRSDKGGTHVTKQLVTKVTKYMHRKGVK